MRTLIIAFLALATGSASATSISEFLTWEELVCDSQIIAVVRITGGEAPEDARWVFEGRVTHSVRGVSVGSDIYFGHHLKGKSEASDYYDVQLGAEYVVFLQDTGRTVGDVVDPWIRWVEAESRPYYGIRWVHTGLRPIDYRPDFGDVAREVRMSSEMKPDTRLEVVTLPEDAGDLAYSRWALEAKLLGLLSKISAECK